MKTRYKSPFSSVSIVEGFADDCDELIQRCLQSDTLNYHVFCNIWKDMNFALVFHDRTSGAEVAEVSEELIFVAKRYMLANTSNYEESVAGLFLVYGLVHLQPYSLFASLRVTPNDLDAVQCIEDIARKQKRYDVLYILGSLLIEGPVEFHIAEREYGIEPQIRKNFYVSSSLDKLGARPKGVFFRHNEELDILRELSSLGRRYTRAKAVVTGSSKPDRTLSYVPEHMPNELFASLKQIINGNENVVMPPSHHDKVQSIKHRAMVATVNEMKHLKSAQERTKPADDGASTSKPIKLTKIGKSKTADLKIIKNVTPTNFPRKRETNRRTKMSPKKKRAKYESSDSNSDDDNSIVLSGDSDDDISSEKESDTEDIETDKVVKKREIKSMVEIEIDTSEVVPYTVDAAHETENIREIEPDDANEEIEDIEERIVIEVIDDDVTSERPSVICENSNSRSSAELIIPDVIEARDEDVAKKPKNKGIKMSQLVTADVMDGDEHPVDGFKIKGSKKSKKGGLRKVVEEGNKNLSLVTRRRLNRFGILPVVKKKKTKG